MTAVQAREESLRRFGSVSRVRDETCSIDDSARREQRRMELFDSIRRAIRLSVRSLTRAPVFTAVAVLTLALGIGATTAIFSLINSVVLRPLPYPESDRLVALRHAVPGISEQDRWGSSVASYFHYLDNNRTLESVAAYTTSVFTLAGEGGAERLTGARVTPSMFDVLGVRLAFGRAFTESDMGEGAEDVALLGYGAWNAWFGGDAAIVGRTVQLNSRPVTIIGIVDGDIHLPGAETHVWQPLTDVNRSAPVENAHWVGVYGRLRPGIAVAAANADIQRLTAQLPDVFPRAYGGGFMETSGFRADVTGVRAIVLAGVDRVLWMLLGAVGFVLLIACANVANLLLVRAEGRRREHTVRAAMGAERAHFAVQYLTESLLLTLVACGLGLLAAHVALRALVASAPVAIPRLGEVALDGTSALFAVGLALVTALVFGLAPVARSSRDFSELRDSGRGATPSRQRQLVRSGLIVGQVALALILLAGGGLMLQSFMNLRGVESGIDHENVLTFQIFLPPARYPGTDEVFAFEQQFAERVRSLAGVQAVGGTTALPLAGAGGCAYTVTEGMVLPPGTEPPCLATIFVRPGFFDVLRIPVEGAAFTWSDVERRAGGVVVSRALAERLWPGEDPLGKGIISFRDGPPWYRVIGVAGDVRHAGLDQPPIEAIYYPSRAIEGASAYPFRGPTYVIRTSHGDPMRLREPVRRVLASLDPEVALANVRTMREVVMTSPAMARTTFTMTLLGIAAAMALFLSAVGLYGVIAYLVGRRQAEIGIRMALGARVSQVARLVLVQSVRLTLAGIVLGVAGALLLTGTMEAVLYGVSPAEPAVMAAVSVLLLVVAVLASLLPARRAARTDPAQALRSD
jgi:putative ABC transport system permease protein